MKSPPLRSLVPGDRWRGGMGVARTGRRGRGGGGEGCGEIRREGGGEGLLLLHTVLPAQGRCGCSVGGRRKMRRVRRFRSHSSGMNVDVYSIIFYPRCAIIGSR
jgi:hypothetical protein